jgi:hypothetical protein
MSHIDLTARLAGITNEKPPERPLIPAALIERFCKPGMQSSWRSERHEAKRETWHAGFCGCTGSDGFDDGYSYMEALMASGWVAMPDVGDWPLVIYLLWSARETDERWAIAHYCEGDFGVAVYDDKPAATAAYRELRAEHPAP